MGANMKAVESGTKAEKAYAHISDMLGNSKIEMNNLTEKKIIEMTGFSRSPVRDSLLRLEAEGVIRFIGHRRGRLIEYIEAQKPEDILYRYELREYIQSGTSCLAAKHFNGWQNDHLRKLLEVFETPEGQPRELTVKMNSVARKDFYDYLIENSGNPYFYEIWQKYRLMPLRILDENIREKVEKIIKKERCESPSLTKLVCAIASHDAELADEIAKKQVQMISSVLRKELYS